MRSLKLSEALLKACKQVSKQVYCNGNAVVTEISCPMKANEHSTFKQPVYLIDASIYIFRAYFSLPDTILNQEGRPINAVYGFALFLAEFIRRTQCIYVLAAFDESLNSCFRNKLYPGYKANRAMPDEDLAFQLKNCQQLCRAMGILTHKSRRYEADDIIASTAKKVRSSGRPMVYVSRDKDLAQLIQQQDIFWNYQTDKKISLEDFAREKGFNTEFWPDYLALTGDVSDNIPGVPGIGEKTAGLLMQYFNGLETLYDNLNKVPELPLRGSNRVYQQLCTYEEQVFLMRELTRIHADMPLSFGLKELKRAALDKHKVARFCAGIKMAKGLERAVLNRL